MPLAVILLLLIPGCCCLGSGTSRAPIDPPPVVIAEAPPSLILPTCSGPRCPILPGDVVVADVDTVFVGARDRIVAIDPGATSMRLVASLAAYVVTSIAISPTHVYWAELHFGSGGFVARAPRDGGPREVIHALSSHATQLAVDELGICWVADARLECAELDGREVRVLSAPVSVFAFGPANSTPREMFTEVEGIFAAVPRAGGPARVIDVASPVGRPAVMAMLLGEDGLYVAETTSLLYGDIARRSLDGGARTVLAAGQWWPTALGFVGDRVIGTASHVGLVSVPRAGGAATVPMPHGVYEVHVPLAVTGAYIWIVQGDPSQLYRIDRSDIEASAASPAAPL